MNIPEEAVEAAALAYINLWSVEVITSPQEYAEAMLGAAAPYMLSAAWSDGHEAGFWNGRESAGTDETGLCGVEHAKANNPYKGGGNA